MKFSDITSGRLSAGGWGEAPRDKIIPFFEINPIMGVKHCDYSDFKTAAELIENKFHLTQTGLKKILSIKAGMNKGR